MPILCTTSDTQSDNSPDLKPAKQRQQQQPDCDHVAKTLPWLFDYMHVYRVWLRLREGHTLLETEMAASISRLTKFRNAWFSFPCNDSTEEKVSVVSSSSTLRLGQSQPCASCGPQTRASLLPFRLCDHCVTVIDFTQKKIHFSNILLSDKQFFSSSFFSKLPWQFLASPPRNTVAVATCSLTILCFYCPVPYSTLLCLAEPDERLPCKTGQ